ncbi:hypothetical protein FQN60_014068, partial [Etheostoma spectabile]
AGEGTVYRRILPLVQLLPLRTVRSFTHNDCSALRLRAPTSLYYSPPLSAYARMSLEALCSRPHHKSAQLASDLKNHCSSLVGPQAVGGDGSDWCQECVNGKACRLLFWPLKQLLFIEFGIAAPPHKGWTVEKKPSPSAGKHWNMVVPSSAAELEFTWREQPLQRTYSSLLLLTRSSAAPHTAVSLNMDANIVVMGTESVGKSALTVRLLTRRFIGEYGNIESIYSHSYMVDGREITLNVWDSPCSEWADGYVLVYSICDRASFNTVSRLIQTIKSTKDYLKADKAPIVIVGNKRDLHHRRIVLSEEGQMLALNTDCLFYEVSAAENYHSVLMVFHGLLDRVKDTKLTMKRPLGFRGIVKSMSAVFARRRTDSF